jgi:hypothetical protein
VTPAGGSPPQTSAGPDLIAARSRLSARSISAVPTVPATIAATAFAGEKMRWKRAPPSLICT